MAHSTAFVPGVGESLPSHQHSYHLAAAGNGGGSQPRFFADASRWRRRPDGGRIDAFANTFFLMGMFERQVREWAGPRRSIQENGPVEDAQL